MEILCAMTKFKVSPTLGGSGKYPYKIYGATREQYTIIMNFLNTMNLTGDNCGYSVGIMGDVISREEYQALLDNSEVLDIELEIIHG